MFMCSCKIFFYPKELKRRLHVSHTTRVVVTSDKQFNTRTLLTTSAHIYMDTVSSHICSNVNHDVLPSCENESSLCQIVCIYNQWYQNQVNILFLICVLYRLLLFQFVINPNINSYKYTFIFQSGQEGRSTIYLPNIILRAGMCDAKGEKAGLTEFKTTSKPRRWAASAARQKSSRYLQNCPHCRCRR